MTSRLLVRISMCTAALVVASATTPEAARAASPGERGALTLGVERMFGLHMSKETNGDASQSRTDFSLLTPPAFLPPGYAVPRLAMDYAVIEHLTVGLAMGFAAGSLDDSDDDEPSYSVFFAQPRVGYMLGLGGDLGLWLRGGLTYARSSIDHYPLGNIDTTSWDLGLDLEPTLVFMAAGRFGVTVGAVIDLPIDGEREVSTRIGNSTLSSEDDRSVRNIGIVFGLLGVM